MRWLPCGPQAVLVEFDRLDEVVAAAAAVRSAAFPEVVDVVPAARTVLVTHRSADTTALTAQLAILLEAPTAVTESAAPNIVTIPVHYDGDDLVDVARATGLEVDEVVALHAGAAYQVAFCGFRPGFAYLVGLPPRLSLPRRATPRPRVSAGSVAIADGFSAVYPSVSPGGWHLLGRTSMQLWHPERERPAVLEPGTRVVFEAR